ncbi:MAG: hypothetical protein GYA24_02750 [Candidatus Lokiarchaeota archaeon]|nr:hypothetical protein [Candidatus Lokiarchaeota archaeon]
MPEKADYKQYRGTASYQRFRVSVVCAVTLVAMYGFIELLWGLLGYYLEVDSLMLMALYANFVLTPLVIVLVVFSVVNFKKFKQKVDDGSIKDEANFTRYLPGGYISSMPVPVPVPVARDALLTPAEKKVKGLIQMYPKITMVDIAAKAGIPGDQVEDLLLKLLSSGVIKGHVDPGTGEFISGMIDTTRVKPVDDAVFDCPYCGAVMKSAPVKGTSVRCESCKNLIVVN